MKKWKSSVNSQLLRSSYWKGAEQTTVYHLTPPHKHLPLQRCSRSHAPSVAFSGVDVWLLRFPLFWAFLVFLFPDSKGDIAHLYTACVVCNYHSWGSSGVFSKREVCVFSSSVYVLGCYVSNVKRDTNPRTAGFTPEFILRSFQLGMVSKQRQEQKPREATCLRRDFGQPGPKLLVSCTFIWCYD